MLLIKWGGGNHLKMKRKKNNETFNDQTPAI